MADRDWDRYAAYEAKSAQDSRAKGIGTAKRALILAATRRRRPRSPRRTRRVARRARARGGDDSSEPPPCRSPARGGRRERAEARRASAARSSSTRRSALACPQRRCPVSGRKARARRRAERAGSRPLMGVVEIAEQFRLRTDHARGGAGRNRARVSERAAAPDRSGDRRADDRGLPSSTRSASGRGLAAGLRGTNRPPGHRGGGGCRYHRRRSPPRRAGDSLPRRQGTEVVSDESLPPAHVVGALEREQDATRAVLRAVDAAAPQVAMAREHLESLFSSMQPFPDGAHIAITWPEPNRREVRPRLISQHLPITALEDASEYAVALDAYWHWNVYLTMCPHLDNLGPHRRGATARQSRRPVRGTTSISTTRRRRCTPPPTCRRHRGGPQHPDR